MTDHADTIRRDAALKALMELDGSDRVQAVAEDPSLLDYVAEVVAERQQAIDERDALRAENERLIPIELREGGRGEASHLGDPASSALLAPLRAAGPVSPLNREQGVVPPGGVEGLTSSAAHAPGVMTAPESRRAAVTVAALFVDPKGVYANLPDVEVWDEARDARTYAGPWPVVAHPPCHVWAKLGRRETRGQDGGSFACALAAVRRFRGVLEHPAESGAWKAHGLPRPRTGAGWAKLIDDPGWVCVVDQNVYGFKTRKPTWLYYVGPEPPAMDGRGPTSKRGCDSLWSTEREHTPPAFRDVLLDMARSAALVSLGEQP